MRPNDNQKIWQCPFCAYAFIALKDLIFIICPSCSSEFYRTAKGPQKSSKNTASKWLIWWPICIVERIIFTVVMIPTAVFALAMERLEKVDEFVERKIRGRECP